MKILGIIPARKGSKGIPGKNIQKISGRPLIGYTINAAKKSAKLDKIIVSTDSAEIAHISKLYGAEVPFLRPKKISGDKTPTIQVIKHALKFLSDNQSYVPDIVVILQPTSPLRTGKMIDKSIEILIKRKATSVLSVSKIRKHPYWSFQITKNYLKPFNKDISKYSRRQLLPSLFYPTGSIYTFWTNTLKRYDSIFGPKIKPMMVDDESNIDIDEIFDLFIAEMALKFWNKYKKRFLQNKTIKK